MKREGHIDGKGGAITFKLYYSMSYQERKNTGILRRHMEWGKVEFEVLLRTRPPGSPCFPGKPSVPRRP